MAVGRKENEITQAKNLLQRVKIAQKVVTADALHTQRSLSAHILDHQGHYLFPVKDNQPRLHSNIQQLFAPQLSQPGFGNIPTDFLQIRKVNKGHGRIEIRTLTTSEMLNTYSDWPGLAQVYCLERQFQWWRNGKPIRTSKQVEYGITSLPRKAASPARLLEIRRSYCGIETGSHYRRDTTLKEDAIRLTVGNAGQVMASIHNLVLTLIRQADFRNAAQARRWFAGHLDQAFSLLLVSPARL